MKLRAFIVIMLALLPGSACLAQIAVIVGAKSNVERLSREEVINIFLGRFRQLPSGTAAIPIDLPSSQPERAIFYRQLVNKEPAEISAYWARLVFSGRTSPPRNARSNEDMLDQVANLPGAVGYVDRAKVDGRVRIVLDLEP